MYSGRGNFAGKRRYKSTGPKPVKAGDEVDVAIEAIAARGDGIGKKDGFVIFVKGAAVGQNVHVRITDVRERFALGEIIEAPAQQAPQEPQTNQE